LTLDDADGLLQTSNITTLLAEVSPIIPLGRQVSLLTNLRLRVSSMKNDLFNLSEYDFVGGFIPGPVNSHEYWGVGANEYLFSSYFYGKLGLQWEVKRNLFIQGVINYLDTEYPVKWVYPDADIGSIGDKKRTFSFGALVGLRSPLGPMAIAVAKDHNKNDWKASLIIGFHY
jgi:hypothetical protein